MGSSTIADGGSSGQEKLNGAGGSVPRGHGYGRRTSPSAGSPCEPPALKQVWLLRPRAREKHTSPWWLLGAGAGYPALAAAASATPVLHCPAGPANPGGGWAKGPQDGFGYGEGFCSPEHTQVSAQGPAHSRCSLSADGMTDQYEGPRAVVALGKAK